MSLKSKERPLSTVDYFNVDDLKVNLKKHAVRGGGITLLSRMIDFLIQMITTMMLARILAPEEFGLVAMATALGGFLTIFIDLGLTDSTIQTSDINHKQVTNLFWINVVATGAIVLMVIALSPLVAWFYSEKRLINIMIIWSTYLFVYALSTQHIALLKRRMMFLRISITEIVATLISSGLAIILALYGWGYWSLVLRQVLFGICMTSGAWIVCRWYPGLPSLRTGIESMLKFGRNATGSFIVGYFARNLDKILIGWRFGANQLGYYHRAYYLFLLPATQSTEALKNVATSTLSKLRSEPSKYHSYYLRAVSLMSFIGMPISFFFMIESENLILLLFGSQWEPTVEIFRILAAGTGVWIIYSTKYWLHASLGRSDRLIKWGIFDFFVSAIAILIGLHFGPKGVALAYTCSIYLLTGLGLQYAGKPIDLKLRSIILATGKYFLAALFAGLLCWYVIMLLDFAWNRLARLIISFLLYTSLYLIFLVVFYKKKQPIIDFWSVISEMGRKSSMPISNS